MSNTNQVEVVKKALDLMKSAERGRREIRDLERQKDDKRPQKREVTKQPYPKVNSTLSFKKYFIIILIACVVLFALGAEMESMLVVFLGMLWLPAELICYFGFFSKRKKAEEERLRAEPEYRNACLEIDRYYEAQVHQAEMEFAAAQKEYNEEILPGIESEIGKKRNAVRASEGELKDLFETSKIIPKQYQNTSALEYLYDMMSTSEYDIKEAINSYERDMTRRREEEAMRLQAEANAIEDARVGALEEANYIADRTRREQRRQAVVGMVQNHNRNKALDRLSRK